MHNGCICCTLRGDLLKTAKQLALDDANYDYLVIESTGISEPLPVAQTFVLDANGEEEDEDGDEDTNNNKEEEQQQPFEPLSNYARMDTLVTVIDAYNFISILGTIEQESDRNKYFGSDDVEGTEGGEETIVQLLIDQFEFCNVILPNKIDLLTDKSSIDPIKAIIKKLNPKASIITPDKPYFNSFNVMDTIINTNLFNMEEAQESAGWIAELEKSHHTPETEEYGVNSFVFRNDERPFHPERLTKIMKNFGTSLVKNIKGKISNTDDNNDKEIFSSVIRCKGELWLSNVDACPVDVHSVGRQLVLEPAGRPWMGKVVETHPNGDIEGENPNADDCEVWESFELTSQTIAGMKLEKKWNTRFGDRRSELVFIGIKLNEKIMRSELNNALLTDEELNVPESEKKKVWADSLEDSFFDGVSLWALEDIMGVEEDGEDENEMCNIQEE